MHKAFQHISLFITPCPLCQDFLLGLKVPCHVFNGLSSLTLGLLVFLSFSSKQTDNIYFLLQIFVSSNKKFIRKIPTIKQKARVSQTES